MYRRIGSMLLIAAAAGMLGALPASACDGCACGGAGYGYYGYGPSWGYSSAYVVAPAFNPAPVVAFVPAAPRVYYSGACLRCLLRAELRLRLLAIGWIRLAWTLVDLAEPDLIPTLSVRVGRESAI